MYKKFLAIILSACLAAICMCGLIACERDGADYSKTETFYAYDVETDEYDDGDYLEVTDAVAVWHSNDVVLKSIEFKGNVSFDGNTFTMTLNGSFSALDTCLITFRGERESDGVLRIDSMVMAMYSEYVSSDPVVTTYSEVMYYCKKNSAPEDPIFPIDPTDPIDPKPTVKYTVTLDPNGGAFASGAVTSLKTNDYGRIDCDNIAKPTRNGFVFKGYNLKADGSGDTVGSATVFTDKTTVYAVWAKAITVTFMNGETVFATKEIGEGDKLGACSSPASTEEKTFVGWFNDGTQYTSKSVVHGDITLTAHWRTPDDIDRYLLSLKTTSQPGHLYIHYFRVDHLTVEEGVINNSAAPTYSLPIESEVYGDWAVWAWPKNGVGRTFNAAWIDLSGAVFDIDCTYTFTDCGWDSDNKAPSDKSAKFDTPTVGVQFFKLSSRDKSAFWVNDGGSNNYDNSSYNHIFVTEGRAPYPVYYNSDTGEFSDAD